VSIYQFKRGSWVIDIDEDSIGKWTTGNGMMELRRLIYTFMYGQQNNTPFKSICVLGGHSVYEAFAGHYTEIHHTEYRRALHGHRGIELYSDNLYPPSNALMFKPKSMVNAYVDDDLVYTIMKRDA
jgi:hypothetical protein